MRTLKQNEEARLVKERALVVMERLESGPLLAITAPPKPTIVKAAVTEEGFTAGLRKIIDRDYFPELHQLQEYRRWKEQKVISMADLLSTNTSVHDPASGTDAEAMKDAENLTLSQYLCKYTR